MEQFFAKTEQLHKFKDIFAAANVTDDLFFKLSVEDVVKILNNDMGDVTLFLSYYNAEKQNIELSSIAIPDANIENVSDELILDEVEFVDVNQINVPDLTSTHSEETPDFNVSKESHHNIPDDFEFQENSLYFDLKNSIEGQIILGTYKIKKILLEGRLKKFVIQKLIIEDPVEYKISKNRFEDATRLIKEVFITVNPDDWYKAHHTNIHGQAVTASGCLINYYKIYRKDLKVAALTSSVDQSFESIAVHEGSSVDINIEPLIDNSRSHRFPIVYEIWEKSFEKRKTSLISKSSTKKVIIKYETYLNTYVCLHASTGLELLESDCATIIADLATNKAIPKKIADGFATNFDTRWPIVADKICRYTDSCTVASIKSFKAEHNLEGVPKSIKALFYLAIILTKSVSITTKHQGTFTFSREDCVDHFIKVIEDESAVGAYIAKQHNTFTDLGLSVAPYVVFCGTHTDITKAFVVVDTIKYEIKDSKKAVECCLKASVALHCWTSTCANVWLYLLEHVYYMRPNVSIAFPPTKSSKTVSNLIKKIDPNFSTA